MPSPAVPLIPPTEGLEPSGWVCGHNQHTNCTALTGWCLSVNRKFTREKNNTRVALSFHKTHNSHTFVEFLTLANSVIYVFYKWLGKMYCRMLGTSLNDTNKHRFSFYCEEVKPIATLQCFESSCRLFAWFDFHFHAGVTHGFLFPFSCTCTSVCCLSFLCSFIFILSFVIYVAQYSDKGMNFLLFCQVKTDYTIVLCSVLLLIPPRLQKHWVSYVFSYLLV